MSPPCTEPRLADRAGDYLLGRLSERERTVFEDHVAGCPSCAESVLDKERGLARLERALIDPSPRPYGVAALWRLLSRTILHPAPAFAYLLALTLAYPAFRLLSPVQEVETAPAATVPRVVRLTPEMVFRGPHGEGEPAAPAVEIAAVGEGPLMLEIDADLDESDLSDPGAAFEVEILDGERVVTFATRAAGELGPAGRVPVLLDPRRLAAEREHAVALRFRKPGDPRDGEELFRRSFRIVPAAGLK